MHLSLDVQVRHVLVRHPHDIKYHAVTHGGPCFHTELIFLHDRGVDVVLAYWSVSLTVGNLLHRRMRSDLSLQAIYKSCAESLFFFPRFRANLETSALMTSYQCT